MVLRILIKFEGRSRLVALTRKMAGEIERLEADNLELRFALSTYSEAYRLAAGRRGNGDSLNQLR